MTGPHPLQYGKYYHIYNRGNNRENIFREERNYPYFLRLYKNYIDLVADTYAYCLMRNHLHLLVRIKTAEEQMKSKGGKSPLIPKNPSQQFGNLFNAYAKAMNKVYGRTGSLFQNPFKRIEVTTSDYFVNLVTYIHQNPQKHRFVEDFRTWPYSSYQDILTGKPSWLRKEDLLTRFHGDQEFLESHQIEVGDHQVAEIVSEDED